VVWIMPAMQTHLEQHQVWLYLLAIIAGIGVGRVFSEATAGWELMLWPALGALLFCTFLLTPLQRLKSVLAHGRFVAALLTANFVLVPLVVAALLWGFGVSDPAVRLGIALVLLVPCTDWFITFTHLGKGDGALAVATAPLLLVLQLILLPVYLPTLLGLNRPDWGASLAPMAAFVVLVLMPLLLAAVMIRLSQGRRRVAQAVSLLSVLPIPLLALVLFLIAALQMHLLQGAAPLFMSLTAVLLTYLMLAALMGKTITLWLKLPAPAGRTLTFSLATRNSFVMLPIALALPEPWRIAVVVIVFQSLVELFGMTLFLRWMPRWISDAR
jgi:arsenite transporter